MTLHTILEYSHKLMKQVISEGDTVIDGTCGNGHDTLLLSELTGKEGHVYGFDIQKQAIDNTKQRLNQHSPYENVTLIHDSHSQLLPYLPGETKVKAAIYNLGYLPGSDKTIVTTPADTLSSVKSVLSILKVGGLLVLVVYHGHAGGKEEKEALLNFVSQLDQKSYRVLQYGFINQKNNPPFILAIEKQKA